MEREDGGIAGRSAFYFGAKVVANAGWFVSAVIVARALGPEGRGTVAFVTVLCLILGVIARVGAVESLSVLGAQVGAQRGRLLANAAALSAPLAAALGLAAMALLESGAGAVPEGVGRTEAMTVLVGSLAVATQGPAYGMLSGAGLLRRQALGVMAAPWAYAGMMAFLWLGPGLDVAESVVAWAAAQWIGALVYYASVLGTTGFGPPDRSLLGDQVRFALRAWAGGLAAFLNARIDQVITGLIATEAVLGAYAVAVNVSEVLLEIPLAVSLVMIAVSARSTSVEGAERALAAVRATLIVTTASLIPALLLGPWLIPVVFGDRFEASVDPFVLLAPGALAFAVSSILQSALVGQGSPGAASLAPVVALLTGIALDLILIPEYGANGAAIAATLAFTAGAVISLFAYRQRVPFPATAIVPRAEDLRAVIAGARALVRRG